MARARIHTNTYKHTPTCLKELTKNSRRHRQKTWNGNILLLSSSQGLHCTHKQQRCLEALIGISKAGRVLFLF